MKQTTNVQRSIQLLNKIFKAANEQFFNGELETPMITIQSTPMAYGHFTPWEAWKAVDKAGNEKGQCEINIGAGTMNRPIEEVTATMVHEMVHYYCYLKGIKDTSNNGRYHNKRFKKEAEARGLHIECFGTYGWTVTSPTEELIDFCIACGFEDIQCGRNEFTGLAIGIGGKAGNPGGKKTPGAPKKGNSIKWVCPCCGAIVRSTKVLNIVCGDCNEQFVQA